MSLGRGVPRSFFINLKDSPMKIADLLQSSMNEMAETMRRHAQGVAAVIENHIQALDVDRADIVEMAEKARADRLQRLEAFLSLHRSYYDAENQSEQIVVEGRLAAIDNQSRALRALADKILAGEPVMPPAPMLPAVVAVNMEAVVDPPTLNQTAVTENDLALDAGHEEKTDEEK